jgi:hypothetical protein
LRFYSGVSVGTNRSIQLDAFWGWYLRASDSDFPPPARDFEAGGTVTLEKFFIETSYLWPETKKLRVSVGLQWGRW